jgi:hypothetical protein
MDQVIEHLASKHKTKFKTYYYQRDREREREKKTRNYYYDQNRDTFMDKVLKPLKKLRCLPYFINQKKNCFQKD